MALLHLGFRPFFLGAGIYAVLSVAIWMGLYAFGWHIPLGGFAPMVWHAHEMVYGYAMAVVAGFLLTAVRNWTGVQTINGAALLTLFLLWALARLAPFFSAGLPAGAMLACDTLFTIFLLVALALPVIKARQWHQIGILSKLLLLGVSNGLFYAGMLGVLPEGVRWGLYSGVYLIVSLILLMARRVVPFFIEKGVGYPVTVRNWKWLDISSLVLFLGFWIVDVLQPDSAGAAALAALLAMLHSLRLWGWHTHGIWRKPLLWVLYLGYGWIVVGFALKAAVPVLGLSPFAALHAFAAGGIGLVTLGMMCRVALGHTGRNVFEPPRSLSWIFAALFLGATVRVFLPLADPSRYVLWIGLSQALWVAAFAVFVAVYAPMLVRPRVDGRYG